jgi:hypothetical protein
MSRRIGERAVAMHGQKLSQMFPLDGILDPVAIVITRTLAKGVG